MSRAHEPVLLLLTLTLGCASTAVGPRLDRAALPKLPALHAHLSRRLLPYAGSTNAPAAGVVHPPGTQPTEVARADAPRLLTEAQQVLRGQPSPQAVVDAWSDVSGACRAHLLEACTFLRTAFRFDGAKGSPGLLPVRRLRAEDRGRIVELRCTVTREGTMRDCAVVTGIADDVDPDFLAAAARASAHVATFAGHAVEYPWRASFMVGGPGAMPDAPAARRVELARADVRVSPKSQLAWTLLAEGLAELGQDGPELVHALTRLHALAPEDSWAQSELALHALKEGRRAHALALADEAWAHAPFHAYVVEVYAAAVAAAGRCDEATAEQRRALALLPEGWPEPERERFRLTLRDYEEGCMAAQAGAHD